jgi:alpha-beta hydrolase superfamily lysophospholipase
LVLALVIVTLAWVAWHATGRGARAALGEPHVAPAAADAPPVRYALQTSGLAPLAPTVVLLASLGRPVSDFNELAAALHAAGYRTLAVESRGIGTWAGGGPGRRRLEALADDALRALTDAGVPVAQPVYVVGHALARGLEPVGRAGPGGGGQGGGTRRIPRWRARADAGAAGPARHHRAAATLEARYGERVTLVPIEQAGHALLPEQPQAIAAAVLAFLAAHPASPATDPAPR